jgi:hypothetical protein
VQGAATVSGPPVVLLLPGLDTAQSNVVTTLPALAPIDICTMVSCDIYYIIFEEIIRCIQHPLHVLQHCRLKQQRICPFWLPGLMLPYRLCIVHNEYGELRC